MLKANPLIIIFSLFRFSHAHFFLPFAHYNKKGNHEVGKNYHENATRHFLLGALIVSPIQTIVNIYIIFHVIGDSISSCLVGSRVAFCLILDCLKV